MALHPCNCYNRAILGTSAILHPSPFAARDSNARKLLAGSWGEAGSLVSQALLLVAWAAVLPAVLVAVPDSFQVVLMDIQVFVEFDPLVLHLAVGVPVAEAVEHIAFELHFLVEYRSSVRTVAYLGHFPET